jgi:hypothetical protein
MRAPSSLLLLPLSVWLGSCAASAPSQRAAPSSPAQGRTELAELEGEIARNRVALGLPARTDKTEIAADQTEHLAAAGQAEPSAPPPAAAPAPAERVAQAKSSGGSAREEACNVDPCRYTKAICDAAARICDIARYLGDGDARSRCGRAQQDCSDARRTTGDRCPGC